MKKILKYSLIIASLSYGKVYAQAEWPGEGKWVLDTLKSKTSCQPLVIAAGGMFEMSEMMAGKPSGDLALYGFARYRVGKIFSASMFITKGALTAPNGGGTSGSQEFRGVLFFKKTVEYQSGVKVIGTSGGIGTPRYTHSAPYNYPKGVFVGLTGSFINRRSFETIKSDSTGMFGKIVSNSDNLELKGSNGIVGVNSQVVSAGLAVSSAAKFKGRIRATLNGRHVKRIVRKSMSLDAAFEALIGLNIKPSDKIYVLNGSATSSNNYSYNGTQVKRIGWRIWVCGKINSLVSITMQMGTRPGIKDNVANYQGPKFASKAFQNIYFNAGLGLAIGAL